MTNARYLSLDLTSKPSLILASEGKVNKAISVDLLNNRDKNSIDLDGAILDTNDVYEQIKQNKIADMELTVENLKKGEPYKTDQISLFKPVKAQKAEKKSYIKLILIVVLVAILVILAYLFLMKKSSKKINFKNKKHKKDKDSTEDINNDDILL